MVFGFLVLRSGFWVLGSGFWSVLHRLKGVFSSISETQARMLMKLFDNSDHTYRRLWKQIGTIQVFWTRKLHIFAIFSELKTLNPIKCCSKFGLTLKYHHAKNWSESVCWPASFTDLENRNERQIIVRIGNQVPVFGLLWENNSREGLVNLKKKIWKNFIFV